MKSILLLMVLGVVGAFSAPKFLNPFFNQVYQEALNANKTLLNQTTFDCYEAFQEILDVASVNNSLYLSEPWNPLLIMYVASGKSVNDLGIYHYCQRSQNLTDFNISLHYILSTMANEQNTFQQVQVGLCVPEECTTESLAALTPMFQTIAILSGEVYPPVEVAFSDPTQMNSANSDENTFGLVMALLLIVLFMLMGAFGSLIQYKIVGSRKNISSLVEVSTDTSRVSTILMTKEPWAQFLYCFSVTKNYALIMFGDEEHVELQDRNFEIFKGIRVLLFCWMLFGSTFLQGYQLGYANTGLLESQLSTFLFQVVVSADFAVSYFYFVSGFIGFFLVLKRFKAKREYAPENDKSEFTLAQAAKLTFKRFWRLAFPTYFIVLFASTVFSFLRGGPIYLNYFQQYLWDQLSEYYWTYLAFVANFIPYNQQEGLYWLFFVSNELQLYILVLIPALFVYKQTGSREYTYLYLSFFIVVSVGYLVTMSAYYGYTTLLSIYSYENIFNPLYRKIYAPSGYYALGCIFSLCYYEASVLRRARLDPNDFLHDIAEEAQWSKRVFIKLQQSYKTRILFQILGGCGLLFLIVIRFSDFKNVDSTQLLKGTWPYWLDTLWNGSAQYFFIIFSLFFMNPIFSQKLSLLRKFLSAQFWTPLSNLTFSAATMQGLVMLAIFGSQETKIYFQFHELFFVFLLVLFVCYFLGLFTSLLFEYPFKQIERMFFFPQKKEVKLKKDLCRQLGVGEDIQFEMMDDPQLEDEGFVFSTDHTQKLMFIQRSASALNTDSNRQSEADRTFTSIRLSKNIKME